VLYDAPAAIVGELEPLEQRRQRRFGGRGLGHETNIARGQRGRSVCSRLWRQPSRRSNSGSLAKFAAMSPKGKTGEVLDGHKMPRLKREFRDFGHSAPPQDGASSDHQRGDTTMKNALILIAFALAIIAGTAAQAVETHQAVVYATTR